MADVNIGDLALLLRGLGGTPLTGADGRALVFEITATDTRGGRWYELENDHCAVDELLGGWHRAQSLIPAPSHFKDQR
ncbi:hypothetical protein OTB20_34250 [Streptomyces sp. H27-H1]|uniref:hypothetical protein n=1 Tax=unclassified Streptomyces TaxID=2593676 RepID=UPI002270FF5E|nr:MULTISPECIES: hypothetical protein [unclassified Streptomyces]MCY0931158.1 hypothetical protein [Streptomyces sp. H27-H1]MCY0939247.1 hypothetical protein [Streptomyces sp. H34-S4]